MAVRFIFLTHRNPSRRFCAGFFALRTRLALRASESNLQVVYPKIACPGNRPCISFRRWSAGRARPNWLACPANVPQRQFNGILPGQANFRLV